MPGFAMPSGDIVVTMDADLQNDPRDIPALIEKLETGFDVVSGWRKDRKDGALLRKIPSRIANRMIRWMTGTKVHDLGCSLKVYRKHVTDEMRPLRRDAPLHLGARRCSGRQVGELVVQHRARRAGVSKYGIKRTVKVLLDLMTVSFLRGYHTQADLRIRDDRNGDVRHRSAPLVLRALGEVRPGSLGAP